MSLNRLLVLYIQAADLKLMWNTIPIVQSKVVLRIRASASALLVISGYNSRQFRPWSCSRRGHPIDISVSDKPIGENSSSSEVVSNELMGSNSQISEVAEISTLERDIPRLLCNLTKVVAGLKNIRRIPCRLFLATRSNSPNQNCYTNM
jgi:hypothetical protein